MLEEETEVESSDEDEESVPVVSASEANDCVAKLCNYVRQVNDADVLQLLKILQIKFLRQQTKITDYLN